MYACAGGHPSVVRALLDSGANVEDHNENGHTPLMEAASAGHVDVAKVVDEFSLVIPIVQFFNFKKCLLMKELALKTPQGSVFEFEKQSLCLDFVQCCINVWSNVSSCDVKQSLQVGALQAWIA